MRRFDLKNKLYCIPINLFDAVALLHTEQKVQKCPRSFGGTKSFIIILQPGSKKIHNLNLKVVAYFLFCFIKSNCFTQCTKLMQIAKHFYTNRLI